MRGARPNDRRRTVTLVLCTLLVVGVAAGLGQGLWDGSDPPDRTRALSTDEAQRLARMPERNWDDARAGIRATIGDEGRKVRATGWVDWRRPMVYLALSGTTPGGVDRLVQAVPDAIATRAGPVASTPAPTGGTAPDGPDTIDPYPPPPRDPPEDGWQVRRIGASGPAGGPTEPGTIEALVVLLFTVADQDPAASGVLADSQARWLRGDRAAGHRVDVLLGPAVLPTPPAAGPRVPGDAHPQRTLDAMGGAVQYWLDRDARLHRLEALIAAETPVRVDLDRRDRTAPELLEALGGGAVDPRPVTDREARVLADLRQRNAATGGGEVSVALPTGEGTVRAAGWLDWRQPAAYLSLQAPRPEDSGLMWADSGGVATRLGESATAEGSDMPPVPAPWPVAEWQREPWPERGDEYGGYDLDLLVNEALSLAEWQRDDPAALREGAHRLRGDVVQGRPVGVYEIPREFEEDVEPGAARMRYWVDDESGMLVRLQVRTRSGGFGRLDLRPGQAGVPDLSRVVPPA